MASLMRLRDIQDTHVDLLGNDYFDPTGKTAYGANVGVITFRVTKGRSTVGPQHTRALVDQAGGAKLDPGLDADVARCRDRVGADGDDERVAKSDVVRGDGHAHGRAGRSRPRAFDLLERYEEPSS